MSFPEVVNDGPAFAINFPSRTITVYGKELGRSMAFNWVQKYPHYKVIYAPES